MNNLKKDINMGTVHHGGKTMTLTDNQKNNKVKLQKRNGTSSSGGSGIRNLMTSDMKAMAAKDLQETKLKRGLLLYSGPIIYVFRFCLFFSIWGP